MYADEKEIKAEKLFFYRLLLLVGSNDPGFCLLSTYP